LKEKLSDEIVSALVDGAADIDLFSDNVASHGAGKFFY
jgi:hypothetical protein